MNTYIKIGFLEAIFYIDRLEKLFSKWAITIDLRHYIRCGGFYGPSL
jgi:hypothetical protein